MSLTLVASLVAGLVLLVVGAEALVRGASRLAGRAGVSPLVIGLTVVAFGTSAPEAAVSIQAGLSESGDIAVGNVVGSNIANILLILGLSALVAPLAVSRQLLRLDLPVMLAAGALTYALAWNGRIGRVEGLVLFAGVLLYTAALLALSRRGQLRPALADEAIPPPAKRRSGWLIEAMLVLVGLGLLVGGAHLLVDGAVALARWLGLSELVIGLTVVAVGTSLPELATSVLAVLRGQRDIAVGNVVGSSTFNLLLVIGAAAAISPSGLSISPNALAFDFPVMLAVFVACLPVFFSGYKIERWEGLLFFAYYLAYALYLVLFATGLPALALLRHAMTWYALPLTLAILLVTFVRAWRTQR